MIPRDAREEHVHLKNVINTDKLRVDTAKQAKSEVDSLSWSADGDRFVSCSRDGGVRIFKADKLTEERMIPGSWTFAEPHPVDNNLLAMVSWDGKMRLADLRTAAAAGECDLRRLNDAVDKVLGFSWNLTGTALSLHTRADFVQVVNIVASEMSLAGEGMTCATEVNGTCWDASDRVWTALGGTPGKLLVSGNDPTSELIAHQYGTLSIARSRDGAVIASGGQDSLAVLWDTKNTVAVRSFPGATAPVSCMAFSSDGGIIAWGCGGAGKDGDSALYLAGARTGVQYAALTTNAPVSRVAWHPKEARVAYSLAGDSGSLQVLNFTS